MGRAAKSLSKAGSCYDARVTRLPAFILLAAAGCGPASETPAGPPFEPVATVGELMHDVVYPSAEEVWDAVGTIMTLDGTQEIAPATEDDWVHVEGAATTLMEAGNLLMMDGRALDQEEWMGRSRALIDAGKAVREAAREKNAELLFERGELVYDACQGCHWQYRFEDDPDTIRTH